jgi:site-specific DNA-cytosine methylase
MKVLELFSGTKSFTKVAKEKGCETFTIDILEEFKPNLLKDLLEVRAEDIPFKPNVIWASPPCKTWSIASCYHHWNKDRTPKTEQAKTGIKLLKHTLALIDELKPKYFFIENPRGLMRKSVLMENIPIRHTITYCQYNEGSLEEGTRRMKPTDIWTNCHEWTPRAMCKNGDPCHVSAPRGARTGTQGMKWENAISVPRELCEEILNTILKENKE